MPGQENIPAKDTPLMYRGFELGGSFFWELNKGLGLRLIGFQFHPDEETNVVAILVKQTGEKF